MGRVLRRYAEDLMAGDPVALGVTAVIAVIFLLFCLFWLKVTLDFRREEEEKRRKRGGRK
jgi:hypothetical protein